MTEYQNGYNLRNITQVAQVDQYEASHGLFGELIDPHIVLQGLRMSDHVGQVDDPTAAQASQATHSFSCSTSSEEVCIEFENTTLLPVVLRWMDEKGLCYPNFQWTLEACSSKVQYSRLGHLFVLSIQVNGEEQLLGAYRIRMSLPSESAHYILIEQNPVPNQFEYHLEAVLVDPSSEDELIVASASLDTVGAGSNAKALAGTIKILSKIIGNITKDPDNPKFRSLRLSNPTVQKNIASSWGARKLLQSVGFRVQDDQLVLGTINSDRLKQASKLLHRLTTRAQPGFVAELAPHPPWQGPVLNSSSTQARNFGSGGTHFLSDEEKWKRAERNRRRRGRGGRKPRPGNAPSSNGRWGR